MVPVIVTAVCVFSIVEGLIELIVGKVKAACTVVEPPKATDDPLIVIVEFANFALAIEPASSSLVIDPLGNVIVVPAGNVMVSPFSPI